MHFYLVPGTSKQVDVLLRTSIATGGIRVICNLSKKCILVEQSRWEFRESPNIANISPNIQTGETGNSVLPRYVENSLCVSCTDLAFFFQLSCKILLARSSTKFAYSLKSTRDYHFIESSLSSDQALNIHGQ